jgi:hypothetical protein
MALLIFSHVGDVHSSAVTAVLRSHGVRCETFRFDEFPIASTITYDLSDGGPLLEGPSAGARLGEFRVVWNRRGWSPRMPAELHEEDRRLAAPICERYCDEMRLSPPPGQIWVNGRAAQLAMRSKAAQLELARRVGFDVPETIVTNDPAAARAFVSRPGRYVVKGLSPMHWDEPDRVISLPTSEVTASDLDDDLSVRACPMVYQRLVDKAWEYRVVVFGTRTLWVKLHSQAEGRYKTDWRHGMATELRIEAVPPPPAMEARILAFCRHADLLHASFDLAVTDSGEIVFFEVNEQGQTLWIEEVNPEIRILAHLARFLFDPDGERRPPWADSAIRLSDHMSAAA